MRNVRSAVTVMLLVLTMAACVWGLMLPTTHTFRPGRPGIPVINLAPEGPSSRAFAALLEAEGGLPKHSVHLTDLARRPAVPEIRVLAPVDGGGVEVFPVVDWQIERITVTGGNILAEALEGEMAYAVEMDIRVRYEDGESALLRWEAWGYGFAVGPLALRRSGPAGDLWVVESTWAQ